MDTVTTIHQILSEYGRELIYLLLGLALVIWLTARSGTALKVVGVLMLLASPAVGLGTTRTSVLPRLEPDVENAVLLAVAGLLLISLGTLVTSASALVAEIRALRDDQNAAPYSNMTSQDSNMTSQDRKSEHQEPATVHAFPGAKVASAR